MRREGRWRDAARAAPRRMDALLALAAVPGGHAADGLRRGLQRPDVLVRAERAVVGVSDRAMLPLDEVDLSTPQERGQLGLFDAECEGFCGL